MRALVLSTLLLACNSPTPIDSEPFPITKIVNKPKQDSKELLLIKEFLNQDFPSYTFNNYPKLFKDKEVHDEPTINVGKYYFIAWSLKHGLPLAQVKPLKKEVSAKQALKSSSIGKRLCVSGKIIEIAVRNVNSIYLADGIMKDKHYTYKFTTFGEDNRHQLEDMVKVCGFIVGRYHYENLAGEVSHAIDLVGTWDSHRITDRVRG